MNMKRKGILLILLTVILAAAVPMEGKAMGNKIARLCEAIEKGDNEEAIRIAEGIRDLNAQSSSFPWLVGLLEGEVTTPLVKACEKGNAVMIPWLLEHGARVDYAPGDILYPLEIFCDSGSGAGKDVLQKLLDYGADPEKYKKRPPVFRLAQTLRHRKTDTMQAGVDMVLMLLDSGAAWQDPADGLTLIHYGALQTNGDFLGILLGRKEAAAFLNTENNKGQTPLDLAEQNGNAECVKILLEAGAKRGSGTQSAP